MPPRSITDRDLYRFSLLYELPEFVKAATMPELLGDESCEDVDFADRAGRTYATHTKAAAWVSCAHFLDHNECYPESQRQLVESRLDQAAGLFGIRQQIRSLREKHASLQIPHEEPIGDSHYGWLVKDASGRVIERRLRLINPDEIKVASSWLLEHRDRFVFADRMKIARRIVASASELATPLGDEEEQLYKIAGYGAAGLATVLPAIMHRVSLLRQRHGEAAESLRKLAETIQDTPAALRYPGRQIKLANVLDQLDRDLGLQQAYRTESLVRPEDAVFAVTEKAAREFLAAHIELPSGEVYRRDDLDGLQVSELRERLGDTLANGSTSDGLTVDAEKFAATVTSADAITSGSIKAALAALVGPPTLGKRAVSRLNAATLRQLADQAT